MNKNYFLAFEDTAFTSMRFTVGNAGTVAQQLDQPTARQEYDFIP